VRMSEVDEVANQRKARLKELLNVAHSLRNSLKQIPTSSSSSASMVENIQKLKDTCGQCLELSKELNMEHGKSLSLEMLVSAKMIELDHKHADPPDYLPLEEELVEAEKIALEYRDKNLETRILELLANIYRRTDQFDKEIRTIEKAILLSKTNPKVIALLDAYHRVINYLFEYESNNSDSIVKAHTEYWENYLWLKEQPDFNKNQFIQTHKIHLYKVCIYIANIAGNPLNIGEANPEDTKIALEAYDEAIHVATVLSNNEFLCVAHAHKAMMLMPKLSVTQKVTLLDNLRKMEEAYHPQSTELSEMIRLLDEQLSKEGQQSS